MIYIDAMYYLEIYTVTLLALLNTHGYPVFEEERVVRFLPGF